MCVDTLVVFSYHFMDNSLVPDGLLSGLSYTTLLWWTLHSDRTPQSDSHTLSPSHFGRSLLLLERGQPPILTPTHQWAARRDLGCDRRPFC